MDTLTICKTGPSCLSFNLLDLFLDEYEIRARRDRVALIGSNKRSTICKRLKKLESRLNNIICSESAIS